VSTEPVLNITPILIKYNFVVLEFPFQQIKKQVLDILSICRATLLNFFSYIRMYPIRNLLDFGTGQVREMIFGHVEVLTFHGTSTIRLRFIRLPFDVSRKKRCFTSVLTHY